MNIANPDKSPPSWAAATLMRVLAVEREEIGAMLTAFVFVICVWTSYMVLRPVRDAMGITSGVSKLPLLFWGTFIAMLLVQPAFGWIISRYRRTVALPWIYGFFVGNLLLFYGWFYLQPDHTWIARAFFVWLSVFNLFVLSLFWSICVDVFTAEQARRLFGFIAGGTSIGGIIGPALTAQLAVPLGRINLLLVAAGFLALSIFFMQRLIRWQRTQQREVGQQADVDRKVGGNPFSGLYEVFGNPYLFGLAIFVFLLTWLNTFLYLQQAELVSKAVLDPDRQTALFGSIDFWVQTITLLIQVLALGRLTSRLGIALLMLIVPILMVFGFSWLALNPTLWVLIAVVIVRRVGEYAIMRPCREMLFTTVPREAKYKAKNFIDTVVYRGGDAISGSAYAGLGWLGLTTVGIAWVGALLAALWGVASYAIARKHVAAAAANSTRT